MKKQLFITIKYFLAITIVTGLIYPLFITLVSTIVFPGKASGSLIEKDGKVIGSELIGQKFESDKYFWSRPSAIDYNPAPSSGSNQGPTSDALKKTFNERKQNFIEKNYLISSFSIPNEMLFASGSGVDPHITPESAMLQVERISRARGLNDGQKRKVTKLITTLTQKPQYGFLGNSVVNILLLNLELDKLQ